MVCKNCGECKEAHLEGKRKFTDELVLVCPGKLFSKKPTLYEEFAISESSEDHAHHTNCPLTKDANQKQEVIE